MRLIFDIVYYLEKLCKCEIDSRRYLQYQQNFQAQESKCKSKLILFVSKIIVIMRVYQCSDINDIRSQFE